MAVKWAEPAMWAVHSPGESAAGKRLLTRWESLFTADAQKFALTARVVPRRRGRNCPLVAPSPAFVR